MIAGGSGHAQSTAGTILGTLKEQSGAVIINTQVTLTNIETAQVFQTKTNESGFYRFVNVPPGSYRLTATKDGFRPITREPINLQVEGSVEIDLTMAIGKQSQKVVVTGGTPLIQAETDSLGAVIDQRETNEIPLNGRNPMNLAALVPSVVPQGGSMGTPTGQNAFAAGNYQIGGGMANESATFLDGAPLNSSYYYMTVPVPTQDSLQEFKVDTNNLSAEYGRLAGGAINFRTKSGTNALHGALWEYLRNKLLNANTFFGNQVSLPRPAFTQNQYGFNVGGPLYIPKIYDGKNKTFFFVNWEGFALRQGITDTETMPTAAERNGDLSELQTLIYDPNTTCGASPGVACAAGEPQYNRTQFNNAIIPTSRLNPTAQLYLKQFFPMPNAPGGPFGVNNFTRTYSFGGNNYETVVHIDQNVSDKQHISARYTYWQNSNLPADPLGTGICLNSCGGHYNVNNFVIDDTYTFNSTTILDLRVSYLRLNYNRNALLNTYSLTSLGMPASLASQVQFPSPPVMSVSGFDTNNTFGSQGADSVIHDIANDQRVAGNLTKFLGNHTLKFGGEFERGTLYYVQSNPAGDYNFNNSFTAQNPETGVGGAGLASFLLGYPANGYSSTAAPTNGEMLYPAIFANDDWRATSRLTMHLGIRWENNMPWTERNNLMSYFDPKAINPLLQAAGLGQYPGSVELVASKTRSSRTNQNDYWNEFSPRLGLSYEVAPETVFSLGV
ncbi:MAG: TonB-dependent receptor, partial [Nitrososphaerota archaeon]|nr:TonB-dependent receptor [Nitrososphaerota archaeon]